MTFSLSRLGRFVPALLIIGLASACESNPHAWYRLDDYPSFSLRPILDFEAPSVGAEYSVTGAPPRMILFNDQLNVACGYCHRECDPRTGDLTAEGTASRRDMDISDRFKVECTFCHAGGPRQFTRQGKYADRDMHLDDRRWKCAVCHDLQFKVTRFEAPSNK
jgi:hypothetical protein